MRISRKKKKIIIRKRNENKKILHKTIYNIVLLDCPPPMSISLPTRELTLGTEMSARCGQHNKTIHIYIYKHTHYFLYYFIKKTGVILTTFGRLIWIL